MTERIHITKKTDTVVAPPSKSFAQRALFAAVLCGSETTIKSIGHSDDVMHIKAIIEQLGMTVNQNGDSVQISKNSRPKHGEINIGESGLGTRLAVPILSRFYTDYKIIGHGTILKRPMTWFKKFLPQTGLNITLTGDFLPLHAKGKIKAGHYTVDGSESSQYISGLLMTLPLCKGDSILQVSNPTSTPYIDCTLSVLRRFGIKITHSKYETYHIKGSQTYQTVKDGYTVEGDYSGAAFFIVLGLLVDGITIKNLNPNSVQADKAILEVAKQVGGKIGWQEDALTISPPKHLLPFNFDASHCPDLIPILTVLAAGIEGRSSITGINRLIYKESDRKHVLLTEFSKFGLEMKASDSVLSINGTGKLNSGKLNSNNDHRIAMSGAIASVLTDKGLSISNTECVNKSFPGFWNEIKSK